MRQERQTEPEGCPDQPGRAHAVEQKDHPSVQEQPLQAPARQKLLRPPGRTRLLNKGTGCPGCGAQKIGIVSPDFFTARQKLLRPPGRTRLLSGSTGCPGCGAQEIVIRDLQKQDNYDWKFDFYDVPLRVLLKWVDIMELGKLEKIDLRKVWKHEATDFTTWLAQEENLSMLSDEIGIDISLIQTEASVGKFNVDILAEEENTGRKIIIENQLEFTDHDHLGKTITYASGCDAEIIIWIVRGVRDEHKQAVDWLNEHTDDKINIFAIKMEIWQIGNSPYAPKFHIISQPNDWAKALKKSTAQRSLSSTKMLQLEFWSKFNEYVQDNNGKLRLRKPKPQHWYDISFGNSDSHLCITVNSQSKQLGCELYIPDSKDLFHYLKGESQPIHEDLGYDLEWQELPKKKASRIRVFKEGDITETDQWNEYFSWLMNEALSFAKVFTKNIKKIN